MNDKTGQEPAMTYTETITLDGTDSDAVQGGWSFYSDRVKVHAPDKPFATVEAAQAAAEADYRTRDQRTCNCPRGCFGWRVSQNEPIHYWLERHSMFTGHTVFPAWEGLR